MTCRAALFDLDGTLLDTLAGIAAAMNAVLAGLGFPLHALEDYRRLTGDGVVALVTSSLPAGERNEATIRRAGEMLRPAYLEHWEKDTRPYSGIPELLDALTERRVPLAILSNKMEEFTQLAVRRFLGRWTFIAVVGESARFRRKPDPAGAAYIAAALKVPPSEVAYLGDTSTDMSTALAAGMFPVGALWGFRDEEELMTSGARAVISRPVEFLRFFEPKH
jgi:phosphoglycolate phosphatase